MYVHVSIHEAGHIVVLKAVLGLDAPRVPLVHEEPEPRAWVEFSRSLFARTPPLDPTRIAAFLLGGAEALARGVETGISRSSLFHGLNGPDGIGCDAELLDEAVMIHGADRWRATDMAREVVTRDWELVLDVARALTRGSEIDADALAGSTSRIAPV